MPGTDFPRRPRALLLTGLLAAGALAGCAPPSSTPAAPRPAAASPSASPEASAAAPGTCSYLPDSAPSKKVNPPADGTVRTKGTVKYTLTFNGDAPDKTGGQVTITMDRSTAPCTVNSFISLADQGFYDDTACHRLVDQRLFVLQCGDPTGSGSGGPGYSFADELTGQESYTSGVVAMANSGPNTNGSQFFLVWQDSTGLPPNYTILGRMDKASLDVVTKMADEGQDNSFGEGDGKPTNPAKITKVAAG